MAQVRHSVPLGPPLCLSHPPTICRAHLDATAQSPVRRAMVSSNWRDMAVHRTSSPPSAWMSALAESMRACVAAASSSSACGRTGRRQGWYRGSAAQQTPCCMYPALPHSLDARPPASAPWPRRSCAAPHPGAPAPPPAPPPPPPAPLWPLAAPPRFRAGPQSWAPPPWPPAKKEQGWGRGVGAALQRRTAELYCKEVGLQLQPCSHLPLTLAPHPPAPRGTCTWRRPSCTAPPRCRWPSWRPRS